MIKLLSFGMDSWNNWGCSLCSWPHERLDPREVGVTQAKVPKKKFLLGRRQVVVVIVDDIEDSGWNRLDTVSILENASGKSRCFHVKSEFATTCELWELECCTRWRHMECSLIRIVLNVAPNTEQTDACVRNIESLGGNMAEMTVVSAEGPANNTNTLNSSRV